MVGNCLLIQQDSQGSTHLPGPQVFQLRKSWKFKQVKFLPRKTVSFFRSRYGGSCHDLGVVWRVENRLVDRFAMKTADRFCWNGWRCQFGEVIYFGSTHPPKIPMESENLNMYSVILVVTVAVEGWTQYLNMLKRWFQLMFCRVLKGGCFCCEIRLMEEIMHYLESWMCVDGDILHIVPWDSSPFLFLQMGLAWITQPYPTPKKSNRQKARRYHFHGVEERILGALVASISVRDSHAGGVGRWPVVGCSEKRMTFANFS